MLNYYGKAILNLSYAPIEQAIAEVGTLGLD